MREFKASTKQGKNIINRASAYEGYYLSDVYGTHSNAKEEISCCVRDYDYADCSRDNDELYYMEINEEVKKQWLHDNGIILVNDIVEVIKGRKVPIGTIAKVIDKKPYKRQI